MSRGRRSHALTVPLITDSEGRKFGKSTGGGNIWLDPQMTSPYAWYQYFVNVADADVGRYLRMFTFLPLEEIEQLEKDVAERPHLRAAQRRLATELTTLVHGAHQTAQVVAASQALFGRGRSARARRLDGRRRARGGSGGDRGPRRPPDDRRPPRRHRPGREPRSGAAHGRRGWRVRQQRQGRRTTSGCRQSGDLLHGRWLVVRRGKRNVAGVAGRATGRVSRARA